MKYCYVRIIEIFFIVHVWLSCSLPQPLQIVWPNLLPGVLAVWITPIKDRRHFAVCWFWLLTLLLKRTFLDTVTVKSFSFILCSHNLYFSCTSAAVCCCLVVELQARCSECACICVCAANWMKRAFVAHIHHLTAVSNKAWQRKLESSEEECWNPATFNVSWDFSFVAHCCLQLNKSQFDKQ